MKIEVLLTLIALVLGSFTQVGLLLDINHKLGGLEQVASDHSRRIGILEGKKDEMASATLGRTFDGRGD